MILYCNVLQRCRWASEWVLLSLGWWVQPASDARRQIWDGASDAGYLRGRSTRESIIGRCCQWGKLLSISGSWKSVDRWILQVTFHQWIGGSWIWLSISRAPQGFTGQLDLMLILSSDTCNLSPNLITCRCNMIPLVKTDTQLSNDLDGCFTTFFTNFNQMDAFVQRPHKPESWTGVCARLTWTRVTIVGSLQQQPVLVKRNL